MNEGASIDEPNEKGFSALKNVSKESRFIQDYASRRGKPSEYPNLFKKQNTSNDEKPCDDHNKRSLNKPDSTDSYKRQRVDK